MAIEVTSTVIRELLAEAAAAHPAECCGILLGEGSRITAIVPAANVHPTPRTRFEIDPRALIDAHREARKGGPRVLGYYHSHPTGEPAPSPTDRAMAAGDGAVWAIVGAGEAGFWKDTPVGFQKLSYIHADG